VVRGYLVALRRPSKAETTGGATMKESKATLTIGSLAISYDRGRARNNAKDVGLDETPRFTEDGLEVCGLGTHWKMGQAELVKARNTEAMRIRTAFDRAFLKAPIKGTYILPERGAGRRFLNELDPPVAWDVTCSVSEYRLEVMVQAPAEVRAWASRVTEQLSKVPLGRGEDAGQGGLALLEKLAACPVIADTSRKALTDLISDAKLAKVNRVDFKRRLAKLQVDVSAPAVEPRRPTRAPMLFPEPTEAPLC
jgi:hypothetical protein